MLPLIQARRPKRFQALHRLAFDFFRARAESDPTDSASAAEAIYHGLWLQEPLPLLEGLWRGRPAFTPRIDPDEFEAGTLANVYVRAKAKDRLKPQEIAALPREVALEWLATRKDDLLSDRRLDESVAAIRAAAGEKYAALDKAGDVAAVVARLLYRDGLWGEARDLIGRHVQPRDVGDDLAALGKRPRAGALLSLVRTWATIAGKAGTSYDELVSILPVATAPIFRDRLVQVELLSYVALGLQRNGRTAPPGQDLSHLIGIAAREVSIDQWSRAVRILRLATLTDRENVRGLLALYLSLSDRPPCDPEIVPVVERIFSNVLGPENSAVIPELLRARTESQKASDEVDRLWRHAMPALLQAARDRTDLAFDFRTLVAFQHFDWINPLGNALTRALKADKNDVIRKRLDERKLLRPWPPRASLRRPDGYTIVRWAVDRGRLLHLAQALPDLAPFFPKVLGSSSAGRIYPQRVFGIADALIHWHRTIVQVIGSPGDRR
jgi:hypothetical protein